MFLICPRPLNSLTRRKIPVKRHGHPRRKERDPNPEGGPRLNVKEFRIQGLEDDPDFNISKAELTKRVEAIRFDLMGEGEKPNLDTP